MAYKDKNDSRYKASRMRWYYKNKSTHRAISVNLIDQKRKYINKLKESPCADCGKCFPYYVMDFDHRNKLTKEFNLAVSFQKGWERIKKEVTKCDIVCANCHRIRTFKHLAH